MPRSQIADYSEFVLLAKLGDRADKVIANFARANGHHSHNPCETILWRARRAQLRSRQRVCVL